MKLKIFLDSDSYDCLIKHIPRQAPSRTSINAAVLLGNIRIVECDDVEARGLLVCASERCPAAAARIADAIRVANIVTTVESWSEKHEI